ncbi:hypothetical protein WJX84_010620 [Apatococcus fuscideae]|uniref:Carbohydrate kinase FGGY C-terminal domain-containing protein n=1 Tax=Apatococcus fuscideae TaxID=2026836 RepID=A0AAW1SNQ1_9CHLO
MASSVENTVIDEAGGLVAESKQKYGYSTDGNEWRRALSIVMEALPAEVKSNVTSLAVDGTSATALLVDRETREFLAPPLMYYMAQSQEYVEAVREIAPPGDGLAAPTSTLARLMNWHQGGIWQAAEAAGKKPVVTHHADWIAGFLHGQIDISDWNNSLKLGYEPESQQWPPWLTSQSFAGLLPERIFQPGQPVMPITPEASAAFGLPHDCLVSAGTTDSIAAFLAAGLRFPGDAVTILGSTLAVKMLSSVRADEPSLGIYSQRLGSLWIAGGASLGGGATLLKFFTPEQLMALSPRIKPEQPTGLDYYVLNEPGERFPKFDPHKQPCMEPRPADDAIFLQGLLEAMAKTEATGYQRLAEQGVSKLRRIFTCGGGAASTKWMDIRRLHLPVPVTASPQADSAYGAALLAREGWLKTQGLQGDRHPSESRGYLKTFSENAVGQQGVAGELPVADGGSFNASQAAVG